MPDSDNISTILRKLAAEIRQIKTNDETDKLRKLAQAAQATTALGLLARKLGK